MSTSSAKETISPRAQAEAVLLLAVKAKRAARNKAADNVRAERELLAGMQAKRADLPADSDVIRAHLIEENVIGVKVEIAEKTLKSAQIAFEEAEAEADRAARAGAYDAAAADRDHLVARFDAEYPKHASAFAALLVAIVMNEAECAAVNKSLPDGAKPLRPALNLLAGDRSTASLRIELADRRGQVIWRGDQFAKAASEVTA